MKVDSDRNCIQQCNHFFESEAESEIDSVSLRYFEAIHESFAAEKVLSDQTVIFVKSVVKRSAVILCNCRQ